MQRSSRLETDLDSLTDVELRRAARRGDQEALARLIDRVAEDLSAIIERYSDERFALQDALQQLKKGVDRAESLGHDVPSELRWVLVWQQVVEAFPYPELLYSLMVTDALSRNSVSGSIDQELARLWPTIQADMQSRLDVSTALLKGVWSPSWAGSPGSSYLDYVEQLRALLQQKSREVSNDPREDEIRQARDDMAWQDVLGPLLSAEQVVERTGVESVDDLAVLTRNKRVLGLPTDDRGVVYPEFQFRNGDGPIPEIRYVLQILEDAVATPYTIASWLSGPKDYLDGHSPIRWLELGGDPQAVLEGAEHAAALLSQ
jgi:hypothetical protein